MNKDIACYVDKYKDREDYTEVEQEITQILIDEIQKLNDAKRIRDFDGFTQLIYRKNEKYNNIIEGINKYKKVEIYDKDRFLRVSDLAMLSMLQDSIMQGGN